MSILHLNVVGGGSVLPCPDPLARFLELAELPLPREDADPKRDEEGDGGGKRRFWAGVWGRGAGWTWFAAGAGATPMLIAAEPEQDARIH